MSAKDMFFCPIDGKKYAHRHSLNHHMRSHTGERPFVCKQCNKGFLRSDILASHIKSLHGAPNFECSDCNERFRLESRLVTHKRRFHGVAGPSYKCKQCGFKARYKSQLQSHQRHAGAPRRTYKCFKCCASYSYNVSLRDHKLSCHSGIFSCPGCRVNNGRISRFILHVQKCDEASSKGVNVKLCIQRARESVRDYVKREMEVRQSWLFENLFSQHNNDGLASGNSCSCNTKHNH